MKKIISLNLAILIVMFSFICVVPTAATGERQYSITVGGETFASGTDALGSGWSYSASSGVLTLDGYNGGSVVTSGDLTVYAKNNVNISGYDSTTTERELCGIYVGGSLTLKVNGNMTVSGSNTSSARGGEGILALKALKLQTASGSTLNVLGGSLSHAIRAAEITLGTNGTLTATGGDGCAAMYFTRSLTVSSGTNALFTAGSGAKNAITYLRGATNGVSSDVTTKFIDGNREVSFLTLTQVIYGDVNDDGEVNSRDSVLLAQYLADWNITAINQKNADVNKNGEITASDAVLLAQYLADWDVSLG